MSAERPRVEENAQLIPEPAELNEKRPPQDFYMAIIKDGVVESIEFSEKLESIGQGKVKSELRLWMGVLSRRGRAPKRDPARSIMAGAQQMIETMTGFSPMELVAERTGLSHLYMGKPEEALPADFTRNIMPKKRGPKDKSFKPQS
jgi:hypothetical protein